MGFFIKKDENLILIDVQSIITVEVISKELIIYFENEKLIVRKSLSAFLNANLNNIMQVNRSTLLNINKIKKVTLKNNPLVEMNCGDNIHQVKVTRNFKKQFMKTLKEKNTIL